MLYDEVEESITYDDEQIHVVFELGSENISYNSVSKEKMIKKLRLWYIEFQAKQKILSFL